MPKKQACAQPCAACPWLRANQTPEAVAASPVDGGGVHWFSKENLLRQWADVQKLGIFMPCHKTDENAPFYGGQSTKRQDAHICVGLSVLGRREVYAFMEAGQDFARYKRMPGKRLTAVGLAAWASRLYFGGAIFHLAARKFIMPEKVEDDPRIGLPWADAVHDRKETEAW